MYCWQEELTIAGLAALPVLELRYAIPYGLKVLGTAAQGKVYLLALLGNMAPVLPLLLFFKYFFHRLSNMRFLGGFFTWWFKNVEKKSGLVERWGFWGLILFVAIPLPVTGAWTGTVAATLFEVKLRKAFLAILLGVSLAGILVSLAAGGIINGLERL